MDEFLSLPFTGVILPLQFLLRFFESLSGSGYGFALTFLFLTEPSSSESNTPRKHKSESTNKLNVLK